MQNPESLAEAGRYALYVWGAYGFAGVVLAGMLAAALRMARRARKAGRELHVS